MVVATQEPVIEAGTRVRVTAVDVLEVASTATLLRWGAENMLIEPEEEPGELLVPFTAVQCLERSRGRSKAGGWVVGGILGAAITIFVVGRAEGSTAGVGFVWAPFAALVGGALGGQIGYGEDWEAIPAPRPDLLWSCQRRRRSLR